MAVPSDTRGCCWSALASAVLREKDGRSTRVVDDMWVNGGSGSLLSGEEWQEEAGDSLEGFLELSVDILQR